MNPEIDRKRESPRGEKKDVLQMWRASFLISAPAGDFFKNAPHSRPPCTGSNLLLVVRGAQKILRLCVILIRIVVRQTFDGKRQIEVKSRGHFHNIISKPPADFIQPVLYRALMDMQKCRRL